MVTDASIVEQGPILKLEQAQPISQIVLPKELSTRVRGWIKDRIDRVRKSEGNEARETITQLAEDPMVNLLDVDEKRENVEPKEGNQQREGQTVNEGGLQKDKQAEKLRKPTPEVIDNLYILPSIKDLSERAQQIARRDIEAVQANFQEVDDLLLGKGANSQDFISEAEKALQKAVKLAQCHSVILSRDKEHHLGVGHILVSSQPEPIEIKEETAWVTEELRQATNELIMSARGLAFQLLKLIPAELKGLKATAEAIFKYNHTEDYSVIQSEEANKALSKIGKTDLLLYHGCYTDAFLDMLEDKALLSRKKQLETPKGVARFSTKEGKSARQEMDQVAFSVTEPNWGYTREPPADGDTRHLGLPEDIWIIADGGYLLKEKEHRFFYTDGIHAFGKNPEEGFSMEFSDNPMCLMMTLKRYEVIRQRVTNDTRFSGTRDEVLSFLERKTVLIPEESIPREKTQWELGVEKEEEIKKRIISTSPDYEVSRKWGFVLPSGELGDDQSGGKIMTYSYHSKPEAFPSTLHAIPFGKELLDLREYLREIDDASDWHDFLPAEKALLQQLIGRRVQFLKTLDAIRKPKRILHVGPGADRLPGKVFGKERTVNIAIDKREFVRHQGFTNIEADVADLSAVPGAFDMIYLHGLDPEIFKRGLEQMIGKLNSGGLLAFDYEDYPIEPMEKNLLPSFEKIGERLSRLDLPERFNDIADQVESERLAVLADAAKKSGKRKRTNLLSVQQCFRVFVKKG